MLNTLIREATEIIIPEKHCKTVIKAVDDVLEIYVRAAGCRCIVMGFQTLKRAIEAQLADYSAAASSADDGKVVHLEPRSLATA